MKKRLLPLLVLAAACGAEKPAPLPPPGRAASAPTPVVAAPDQSWRSQPPGAGAAAQLDYPAAETARLANGMSLYVVRRPAGIVDVAVVSRTGANALLAKETGLASFASRMLTEGTAQRSSLELAKAAESLGSTLSHDAGRDYVRVGLDAIREDLPRALELLADVVQRPAFTPAEVERVRSEWIDALEAERQNPMRLAVRAGFRLLLGEPAGAPVSGTKKAIERLRRTDLSRFHGRAFTPASTAVLVAGDVRLADVQPEVERLFGAWRGRTAAAEAAVSAKEPQPNRVLLVDRPGSVQSALFVAQSMPRRAEPGHEARQVMNNAFGGLFTSRLNMNLREKNGYTYGVRSQVAATRQWGAFVVTTSVRTDATADALEQVFAETRRLAREPLTADEIARSKADLIQQVGAHLEHTSSVLGDAEELFIHGMEADYFRRFAALVRDLGPEAVREEAQRLSPERMIAVLVGDRTVVQKALAAKGFRVELAEAALTE